ncbi:4-alpha-glucanotransferase [bacterium]|nr:4-alpha-glucanotransferase [bacterium]
MNRRQAGVLLHPTSLPSPYGIGDLGPEAIRFLDWVKAAGLSLWQVLPLGPTGFADSPYQCFSAFAGNPFMISPDLLRREGLLKPADLKRPKFSEANVKYGPVIEWKNTLLRKAYERFKAGKFPKLQKRLDAFVSKPSTAAWLDDYALFAALKSAHGGQVWNTWAAPLRRHDAKALKQAAKDHADEVGMHKFIQFLFFDQWADVRKAAHERGIQIVGDMPIYVAYDSSDTWASQDLFQLKKSGDPKRVAGVPPDYFSETGQLWGNPLYDWDKMHRRGYKWWVARMQAMLELVDIVRLDHFRGFEGYWSVKFGEETAINGRWVKGPGAPLFKALRKALGELPIIAENLGVITEEVEDLRKQFDLPGMKIMQFGWTVAGTKPLVPDPGCDFQPHKVEPTSVVYTGSHDNATAAQWWREFASKEEQKLFKAYTGTDGKEAHKELIRQTFASVGAIALVPMQDFLGLGKEARMNFPGREAGNWTWRLKKGAASKALAKGIAQDLLLFERHAQQKQIAESLIASQSDEERARKP